MATPTTENDGFTNVYESEPSDQWQPAVGESLIGDFVKRDTITPDDSTGPDDVFTYLYVREQPSGQLFHMSESYDLKKAFAFVSVGQRVRITFTGTKAMKDSRSAMKCYTVAVAK